MKTPLKYALIMFCGILMAQIPDLADLYIERVEKKYVNAECSGHDPKQCDFFKWYPKFENDHPKLVRTLHYFQMGEGPLYWIVSGRCSNRIFNNSNASPKLAGHITNRNYFFNRCSHMMNDLSDLIFRDGDRVQEPSLKNVTAGDRSEDEG